MPDPYICPPLVSTAHLTREVNQFLSHRARLIASCGVKDKATARGAIRMYRHTFDSEAVQIHVRKTETAGTPSFRISMKAQATLWEHGFLRWRYPSLDESMGHYAHTEEPVILCAWGKLVGGEWQTPILTVLFSTATEIGGKRECASVFMIRRNEQGIPWRIVRAYLMECAPESNAWRLGNEPLSRKVLPGATWLKVTDDKVAELCAAHRGLIDGKSPCAFKQGHAQVATLEELTGKITDKAQRYTKRSPDTLASYLDTLLCPDETRVGKA